MGNYNCKKKPTMKIIIQGLDAAGKTTLMFQLKLGEVVQTIPTIGFNVETIDSSGFELVCWDVGGRCKMRPLIRYYTQNTDGFVFVVDSNDIDRLDMAFDEIIRSLREEETNAKHVLVLANKQDLENALSCDEIERRWKEKNKLAKAEFESLSTASVANTVQASYTVKTNHNIIFRPCSALNKEEAKKAFAEFTDMISGKDLIKQGMDVEGAGDKQEMSMKLLMKHPLTYVKALLMY